MKKTELCIIEDSYNNESIGYRPWSYSRKIIFIAKESVVWFSGTLSTWNGMKVKM